MIVEADQAAVDEYAALVSFEKIYVPFDGVVTARNTDIGDRPQMPAVVSDSAFLLFRLDVIIDIQRRDACTVPSELLSRKSVLKYSRSTIVR